MNRRSLILGSLGLLAAPAIVRAENLMKIVVPKPRIITLDEYARMIGKLWAEELAKSYEDTILYGASVTEFTENGPRRIDPREITAKDWQYRVTKAPPGGFKIVA